MTHEEDCVSRKLRAKKAAGIPINAQAIAISMNECKGKKSKNSENDLFQPIPRTYKVIELK